MPGCHLNEEFWYRGKLHPWKQGGCRVDIGPRHLASSGNRLCPLSRTADFEHEVAGANQKL